MNRKTFDRYAFLEEPIFPNGFGNLPHSPHFSRAEEVIRENAKKWEALMALKALFPNTQVDHLLQAVLRAAG